MIWIIASVYLGGFLAVLGVQLTDQTTNTPEAFTVAGAWPIAWLVWLLDQWARWLTLRRRASGDSR